MMSKEITPLQALEEIKDYVINGHSLALETEEKGFPLIKTVLKNEDSEKFELIQQVRELKDDVASLESCNSKLWIENEYYKKVLEIIRDKGIDILEFRATRKAKTYNEHTKRNYVEDYTEEEYNLLKEVLK